MRDRILIIAWIPVVVLLFSCNPQKRLARKRHVYMEKAYKDIKTAINEAEVTIVSDSIKVLFPANLLFATEKADINPATYPVIERFSKVLLKYLNTDILINGYTDNTGTDEINRKLSRARADAAGASLTRYNVPVSRLSFWGHGSNNPIGDNTTERGRAKNRRVEFIVLYKY